MNVTDATLVLGIETSCDETAAALVMGGYDVVSSAVSTQVDLHAQFGGVVPEIASRAHLEAMRPALERALATADVDLTEIDGIAVTAGPGLMGALVVGLAAAKALAELAREQGVRATRIAHGVPLGGELEYVDGGTLAHAFAGRRDF